MTSILRVVTIKATKILLVFGWSDEAGILSSFKLFLTDVFVSGLIDLNLKTERTKNHFA